MPTILVTYPRNMSSEKENNLPQDQSLSEFLLRACHDLRTPLRSIRANAELLLRSSRTTEISDFEKRLGFIVNGARRIELLADGLASYSLALQIERGEFQSTRMDVLLRAVLAKLDKELREGGANVSYGHLPRIPGNPDRLMQVFENLVRNAVHYRSQAPPLIHITAARRAQEWLFAVCDNGRGIEAAYLEKIFKPFERLNGTESSGPGLGLTICRAIVERHGGRIWAESNAGGGTTFLFTLPAE